MAWQDEMTTILRVLIDDVAGDTYTNERLQGLLVVAAFQVARELSFSQDFVVNVPDETISPDPTNDDAGTRDNWFVDLTCQKAACILDRGKASLAAKQAVLIKDPAHTIDLRAVSEARFKLLSKGWCAVYEETKAEYQAGQAPVFGAAVMTPFRLYARETYRGPGDWPGR